MGIKEEIKLKREIYNLINEMCKSENVSIKQIIKFEIFTRLNKL